MSTAGKAFRSVSMKGEVLFGELMKHHTSFRVGGPAEIFAIPETIPDVRSLLRVARSEGVPVFVLGHGANILVSDIGIEGLVIDMQRFSNFEVEGTLLSAGAGNNISRMSEIAADFRLSGLEFIYAMPGSVGGSVWMNARCYGTSISEIIEYVDVITENGESVRIAADKAAFSYKVSPFQIGKDIIVCAGFRLQNGDEKVIRSQMEQKKLDRTTKGHFKAASVGSVFKNNRTFGNPTGKLIDSLGLRGFSKGGARVAEYHANIIVNEKEATATDILDLIQHVEKCVFDSYGFRLEREVLLIGTW